MLGRLLPFLQDSSIDPGLSEEQHPQRPMVVAMTRLWKEDPSPKRSLNIYWRCLVETVLVSKALTHSQQHNPEHIQTCTFSSIVLRTLQKLLMPSSKSYSQLWSVMHRLRQLLLFANHIHANNVEEVDVIPRNIPFYR